MPRPRLQNLSAFPRDFEAVAGIQTFGFLSTQRPNVNHNALYPNRLQSNSVTRLLVGQIERRFRKEYVGVVDAEGHTE